MTEWRPALGAIWNGKATTFTLWAPSHQQVALVLDGTARPLERGANGYWNGTFGDVRPGDQYRYQLGDEPSQAFPDPASRFQPDGVNGPSEVIDPSAFPWADAGWIPPALDHLIFYELHVGTFTAEGTFRSATARLDYLADLGITAIELMPVGDFAGGRNWGYDVAAPFAPSRAYGRPDDLRRFVDAAHARGLAVFLDVVYNHLGPDGAYQSTFSPSFFTDAHQTPWGRGVNLDGEGAGAVRHYFIDNALHWVREYHVDGLRLDATHALQDDSPRHFLSELSAAIDAHAGRPVTLVAEDHRNLASLVTPRDAGGLGIDAVWADDFHHQLRVHTAHDDEGYYGDFTGSTSHIADTIRQGWFFTGQSAPSHGGPRGTDPCGLAPEQFVVCIQNHDQIGNRADGARLNHQVDLATYRALAALLLLVPETPLLFMGQEWAASSPFLFFTDHHAELGRQVTRGRREEFSSFRAFADPRQREAIPDPQDPQTFARSQLRWEELAREPHAGVWRLYQRLLELRRSRPTPLTRRDVSVEAVDGHTLRLAWPSAAALVRLSCSGTVCWQAPHGSVLLTTEDPAYTTDPQPIRRDDHTVTFARPGAIVLSMPLAPEGPVTPNRQ
jgi:maltooligosyltrehalose trehalohydrolase